MELTEHVGLLRGAAEQAAVPERLVAGRVFIHVIAGAGGQPQLAEGQGAAAGSPLRRHQGPILPNAVNKQSTAPQALLSALKQATGG